MSHDSATARALVGRDTRSDTYHQTFELAAQHTCVREARRRVQTQVTEWGVDPDLRDTAVLVTSELVTNALVHTGTKVITCALSLHRGLLRIEVTDHADHRDNADHRDQDDASPGPTAGEAAPSEENGRGLQLISRLSDAWGVTVAKNGDGHMVWAMLSIPE